MQVMLQFGSFLKKQKWVKAEERVETKNKTFEKFAEETQN